jgi:hypothetical protein
MKKLFTTILLFSLFACSKNEVEKPIKIQDDKLSKIVEPVLLGEIAGYFNMKMKRQLKPGYQLSMTNVYNTDIAYGVQSTFDVKNLGGNGATLKGAWVACNIVTPTGVVWIQIGYHQWSGPSLFSMMFYSTVQGQMISTWPVLQSGEVRSFHIRIGEGGNVYTGVDGVDYGMVPLYATHITSKHITLEAEGTTTKMPSFPNIRFNPALELHNGTSWTPAPTGFYSGNGYGVQVNGFNDVTMGSGIKTKPQPYTQIW